MGTLRRQQRQRERHQTRGLMRKTMAAHMFYNSWYISLPFSAMQNNINNNNILIGHSLSGTFLRQ